MGNCAAIRSVEALEGGIFECIIFVSEIVIVVNQLLLTYRWHTIDELSEPLVNFNRIDYIIKGTRRSIEMA